MPTPADQRLSQADRVHRELRDMLLRGELPYGDRLVEEQLAERFGISRTPVREALRRLEGDGHLQRDPAGGMRPRPPRVSTMRDLYELRVVVEDLVVRRAAATVPSEVLDALAAEWREIRAERTADGPADPDPDFVHLDEDFHEALAAAAGNRAAVAHLHDINERIRVVRIHDFTVPQRIETTIDEHIEIVEATAAGRADAAAALMRVHVERSADVVEHCVAQLLTRMFDSEEDALSVATDSFAQALERPARAAPRPARAAARLRRLRRGLPRPRAARAAAVGRSPIAAAGAALRRGDTTSVQLVEQALARIDADNEELVAFVEVLADQARVEAAQRDGELDAGVDRGPLHGIPISVKDVIHVRGATTRCGSDAYEALPDRDAAAVARLRDAGAVILGKTSTHEFALGVTSPQARNPHDRTRIPGGSSGGSAIAVATGMGLGSLGTDTRASIRVPAALCGVVGLKPTYGTAPTDGIVPLSWTMDHAAVLAATALDAALMLDALRPDQPPVALAAGVPVDRPARRPCAGRLGGMRARRWPPRSTPSCGVCQRSWRRSPRRRGPPPWTSRAPTRWA